MESGLSSRPQSIALLKPSDSLNVQLRFYIKMRHPTQVELEKTDTRLRASRRPLTP